MLSIIFDGIRQAANWIPTHASLTVALAALGVSVQQGRATRRHNKLSVRPRLTTHVNRKFIPQGQMMEVTVTLINSGLGPAIIRRYEPLLDGCPVAFKDAPDLLQSFINELNLPIVAQRCGAGIIRKYHALAKDSETILATIVFPCPGGILSAAQQDELDRANVRVYYKSMYSERFKYDSRKHTDEEPWWWRFLDKLNRP